MFKRTLFSVVFVWLVFTGTAQQYRHAFGVKGEWSTLKNDLASLSYKHFFTRQHAIEANLGFGRRFLWLEANHHINFPLANDLEWYLGYGMNLGYWNTNYDNRYVEAERSGLWWGFGGNAGIELTTNVFPLNFALDVGPALSLLPSPELGVKVGFSARYAIK